TNKQRESNQERERETQQVEVKRIELVVPENKQGYFVWSLRSCKTFTLQVLQ
ncbi:hypothetical protein FRX31_019832, partial [Thalictrum thalictroides]